MLSKLNHLKDLGITAAWLSPVMKSPQRDLGYDISDYYTIEPDYGTMEDFVALVNKCHELGIKLLLDFIPNHTSDQHEWFEKSEAGVEQYKDYYIWKDGVECQEPDPSDNPEAQRKVDDDDDEEEEPPCKPPNNWISVFGGPAWTWSEKRQQL